MGLTQHLLLVLQHQDSVVLVLKYTLAREMRITQIKMHKCLLGFCVSNTDLNCVPCDDNVTLKNVKLPTSMFLFNLNEERSV